MVLFVTLHDQKEVELVDNDFYANDLLVLFFQEVFTCLGFLCWYQHKKRWYVKKI